MANARGNARAKARSNAPGKEPEDQDKSVVAAKPPAARTSELGEGDRPQPSTLLTMQTPSSLSTLQRLVGNRAVVDMIAKAPPQSSAGFSLQREDEPAAPSVRAGGNRLYVGNLSPNTSQESLEGMFASAGQVREVAMPTDRETGQPRGFAFVTMGTGQEAAGAIAQLNGAMLDGRSLRVNEAQERAGATSRGGGGGGGGGRGGGGGGGSRGGGRDAY